MTTYLIVGYLPSGDSRVLRTCSGLHRSQRLAALFRRQLDGYERIEAEVLIESPGEVAQRARTRTKRLAAKPQNEPEPPRPCRVCKHRMACQPGMRCNWCYFLSPKKPAIPSWRRRKDLAKA
jgi:hypothetical protein